MAFLGWFALGGEELINGQRFGVYAHNMRLHTIRDRQFNDSGLDWVFNNGPYTWPSTDDAPWFDQQDESSVGFAGVYPLFVEGLDSSTRTAQVTEFNGDGGTIGGVRRGTRAVTFDVLLAAMTHKSLDYGFNWLKHRLTFGGCPDGADVGCVGTQLEFLRYEPEIDLNEPGDAADCIPRLRSTLFRVQTISGPTITAERELSDGTYIMRVSFTVQAGDPSQYADPRPLIAGFPNAADPWVDGEPEGGEYDTDPVPVVDAPCAPQVFDPIYDPNCPPMQLPPGVPQFYGACTPVPDEWERVWIKIPSSVVPKNQNVLPRVVIRPTEDTGPVRNLRLRWWVESDPWECDPVADWLVTWVPGDTELVIDRRERAVVLLDGSTVRAADTLVTRTDSGPMKWLALTCQQDYWLSVDHPDGVYPDVAVDLIGEHS